MGLIGGSVGMALRAAGAAREVVGWNRSPGALPTALERGAIDRAAGGAAEAVADAELVVIGVTVGATPGLLRDIAGSLRPDAVVTDVGSAKARVVAAAEAILPQRFVGSHPMAGSERTGVGAASADLLCGAPWVITPTEGTAAWAVERVERLARAVGAVPRRCGPAEHDRLVATLSHLPHVLAFGLAEAAAESVEREWAGLAAGSFRDGTRVAGSDPAMWAGILLDNREQSARAIASFVAWVERVKQALDAGDAAGLGELLSRAHEAHRRFTP